jgi:hypothetical protein
MSAPQQQQQQGLSRPNKNQSEEVIAASLFSQQVISSELHKGIVMAAAADTVHTASKLCVIVQLTLATAKCPHGLSARLWENS